MFEILNNTYNMYTYIYNTDCKTCSMLYHYTTQ